MPKQQDGPGGSASAWVGEDVFANRLHPITAFRYQIVETGEKRAQFRPQIFTCQMEVGLAEISAQRPLSSQNAG